MEEKVKLVIEINKKEYDAIKNRVYSIREEQRKYGYATNDIVPIGWQEITDGVPYESKYVMKEAEK